jgi:hypothetical protein
MAKSSKSFTNIKMETRFTKGINFYNNLIDETEFGSKCYKLIHTAKMYYILNFK